MIDYVYNWLDFTYVWGKKSPFTDYHLWLPFKFNHISPNTFVAYIVYESFTKIVCCFLMWISDNSYVVQYTNAWGDTRSHLFTALAGTFAERRPWNRLPAIILMVTSVILLDYLSKLRKRIIHQNKASVLKLLSFAILPPSLSCGARLHDVWRGAHNETVFWGLMISTSIEESLPRKGKGLNLA